MLIRRTQRTARHNTPATALPPSSDAGLDRRSFLRRSGLAAGALTVLGAVPLTSMRKAKAGPPPPPGAAVTIRKNVCTHCSVGCTVIGEVADGVWIGQEPGWDSPINRGSHCCKGAAVRDDVLSERRLRYPMKLVNGQWNRISWDQAIDEIGDRLMEIRRTSGPESVYWLGSAKFTNEAAYLNRKLAAFWGTNNSDHQARICHSTTVAGVANTWGYGAMTNSYNDIRNAKTIMIMGGNPAEAHPVSLQHILEGKELNRSNMIVIDPRMTRTAAHATEYVRVRPGTHIPTIYGMLWHIFQNGWEDKEFLRQRVYGMDEVRKEVDKWPPDEVERVTGLPEAQVRRIAEIFAKQRPSTLIWAMGQTQFTVGTANVRASCILLLATGNVGHPGSGANIFRGHTNVQGATDLGLDVTTLPLYYGLDEGAWRHWCRVWDVDYAWMQSRFVSKTLMETAGIPSTRWFDATLLPKDQVAQPDKLKAMVVMGHGGNTITRMPEGAKGMQALDLLVVCDPYPTTWSVLSERKNGTYLLPACTSFEMNGSRTASNRSLQWGEQIVKPIFECKNDYDVMYLLARKLGFAEQMFKNIKVENGSVSAEDILREINRGGWSTGYCGQSPERLKAHMANQDKFDLVTLRAPKDVPGGRRRLLRSAVAVLGHAGIQASGQSHSLQHDASREGRRRHVPGALRRRAQRRQSSFRRLLLAGLGAQGRLSRVHARGPQEARLGQGPHRAGNGGHPAGESRQSRCRIVVDRSFGWHPARRHRAWLQSVWQRQGARARLEPAGSDPGPSRADLHAAARPRRQISDAAGCPAVPRAQSRLLRTEVGGRPRCRQAVSVDPELRTTGRVRRRRRGNALQQVARRVEAGHVRRDQSSRRSRARNQGRRLGLGHGRRDTIPRRA